MRIRPAKQWLLILALLVGQWLVVAHTHSHPALISDQACEICLHAGGISTGGLAALPPALPPLPEVEAPRVAVSAVIQTIALSQARIRGPPAIFGQF